jgi:tetratricopeptide (TPR) repeat protein
MSAPELNLTAAPGVDASNPYPGLQAFGEGDQAYFHGRARERDELFRLVRREVLTVVFGRSGLGKTSLLNAGLFPLLRQADVLPVPIRLDFTPGKADLVSQVRAALAEALRGQEVDAPPPAAGETLWEYFHRTPFWSRRNQLLTPLLVFDQFEEIFTLGRRDGKVEPLVDELADLIENHIPAAVRDRMARTGEELPFSYERQNVRVVFSLREDFLPQLEGLRPRIPSLAGNRFRLLHMDGNQALDAILKPGGGLVSEEVAREILRAVAGASRQERAGEPGLAPAPAADLAEMEVEPALLSLFCRELNNRRQAQGLPAITVGLVQGTHGQILTAFYDQCLADMSRPVRTFVEERLLTGSGFRQSVPLEEALQVRGVTAEDLGKLVNRRLLRLEDRLGRPHVELIHDVMTPVIRESRDRRRASEVRRRLLRRAALAAGVLIAALVVLAVFLGIQSSLKARAEKERTRAELMVNFMLFDLSQKLVPKGELDIVREIAQRALDDLSKAERTDGSELLKGVALSTLGDISLQGGKTDDAQKLYREALDIYRFLHRKEPADHVFQNNLAVVLGKMSGLLQVRGDYRGALEMNSQALSLWQQLLKETTRKDDPQNRARTGYVDAAQQFADLLRGHDRLSKALEAQGLVLRELEGLVAMDPANGELKARLAAAYWLQGGIYFNHGDVQTARQFYRRALEMQERLVQESPENVYFKTQFCLTRLLIGLSELSAGRPAQALAMANSVASFVRPHVTQEALAAPWLEQMALADLFAGDALLAQGNPAAAFARYRESRAIFAREMERVPDQIGYRIFLSWTWLSIGNAHARRGETALARQAWGQAVEIISPLVVKDDSNVLDLYVRPLLALGRRDEALPVCEKLRDREWDFLGLQRLCRGEGLESAERATGQRERPAQAPNRRPQRKRPFWKRFLQLFDKNPPGR